LQTTRKEPHGCSIDEGEKENGNLEIKEVLREIPVVMDVSEELIPVFEYRFYSTEES
jgi:hypothetical protein